jgi:hypothetical protein
MNARFAALTIATILVTASAAHAGTPAELVKEGVALREKGDDKGALEKFREADTAAPSGEAKAQMALAEQALGRWTDAELHLKAALDDGSNAFVKRNRKALEGALETIGKHLATISLVDLPEGSLVAIDDKDFAAALPSYRVSNGVHRFRIRKTGFADTPKDVNCDAGQTCRESVTLLPQVVLDAGHSIGPVGSGNGSGNGVMPAPQAPQNTWMKPVGITLAGVGVVGIGLGIYSEVQIGKADDNASGGCFVGSPCAEDVKKAEKWVTVRPVAFIAGGALFATGAALFLLAPSTKEAPKGASVRCAPTFGGLGCAGTF